MGEGRTHLNNLYSDSFRSTFVYSKRHYFSQNSEPGRKYFCAGNKVLGDQPISPAADMRSRVCKKKMGIFIAGVMIKIAG